MTTGNITMVGGIVFRSPSGGKTGDLDVYLDEGGHIHVRINRLGDGIALKMTRSQTALVAELLRLAMERTP